MERGKTMRELTEQEKVRREKLSEIAKVVILIQIVLKELIL